MKHVAEMFGRDVNIDIIHSKLKIIRNQVRWLLNEYSALHGPERVWIME